MAHVALTHAFAVASLICPAVRSNGTALHPTLSDGDVVGGDLHVETLEIPAGSTVWVEDDFTLTASGIVRIEGRLLAFNAWSLGREHAPSISIKSALAIDVSGTILGGHGVDGSASAGGRGSSIVLDAPIVYIDGLAQAGPGGRGGPGFAGGPGGDARVYGFFVVRQWDDHASLVSGAGGHGGFPGGDGGKGGDAIAEVPDELRERFDGIAPAILEVIDGVALTDDPPASNCANGTPGGEGGNSSSGAGGDGAPGANGNATNGSGQKGGDGRKSGDCTGGEGLNGNPGLDCCLSTPNTGGTGGNGGKGGNATSGRGGNGGRGGDGYQGTNPGGPGGNGGDSGFAKCTKPGNGGNGGKQSGAGGNPGALGNAQVGDAGLAGVGGTGTPNGASGTPGSPGTLTTSGSGTQGNQGGNCP